MLGCPSQGKVHFWPRTFEASASPNPDTLAEASPFSAQRLGSGEAAGGSGKIKQEVDEEANEARTTAATEQMKSRERDEKGRIKPGGGTSGTTTRKPKKHKTAAKTAESLGVGVKAVRKADAVM
jgi:hypothetical protein